MDDDSMYGDWDDDEEDWQGDDDSVDTIPCPACGVDIYEEAELCPACGEYVVHDTHVLTGKPNWYVAAAILGVIAVIFMLMRFF